MSQEEHKKLTQLIIDNNKALNKRLDDIEEKIKPIVDLWTNANVYTDWTKKIVVWFMKLILFGGAAAGLVLTIKKLKE